MWLPISCHYSSEIKKYLVMAFTINFKKEVLHGATAYQGMCPIHLKEFIIFLCCFSAIPALLRNLGTSSCMQCLQQPWPAMPYFSLLCEIPKRNMTTALCSRGGSFSFNEVASFKYRSINGDQKKPQKTKKNGPRERISACFVVLVKDSAVISWHWLPRWLLDWLVNMYFSGAQQNNIPCHVSHSIRKTEVLENVISSLFLLEGLHYHYYKKSASEIVNTFK